MLNMAGSLCRWVVDGAGATANNQKLNVCCNIQWEKKTCQCNRELRNKREHVSLDMFPAYFLPSQVRQIWHFVTAVSCKSQKKYHVFNNTATSQKTSPCIPGSLTERRLAYSRGQYKNSIYIEILYTIRNGAWVQRCLEERFCLEKWR